MPSCPAAADTAQPSIEVFSLMTLAQASCQGALSSTSTTLQPEPSAHPGPCSQRSRTVCVEGLHAPASAMAACRPLVSCSHALLQNVRIAPRRWLSRIRLLATSGKHWTCSLRWAAQRYHPQCRSAGVAVQLTEGMTVGLAPRPSTMLFITGSATRAASGP